jgi:hypothetical protein
MAMDGRIPMAFDAVFPHGAFMRSAVTPVRDWKRSTQDNPQQEVLRDEDDNPVLADGRPVLLWAIDVIDGDEDAKGEVKHRVKIAAPVQPVPPDKIPGTPFRPVVLAGLELRAWVNQDRCRPPRRGEQHRCGGKVAWSFFATGMSAPGGKPAGEKATAANGRGS